MDTLYQQGPVGTQGSEAALGGPLGAVQPHNGHCALLSLLAFYGLFYHHGHCSLEDLGRYPPTIPILELLLPLETSQALIPSNLSSTVSATT